MQRIAWVVFALMLVGCLFGAFGRDGFFARSMDSSEAGVVDFPRLSRWNAPDNLVATFAPSGTDRIFFVDDNFLEIFSLETVDPPQTTTIVKDGLTGYVFSSDPARPTRVMFRLQTQAPGLRTATFGVEGQVAEHSLFVYP